MVTKQKNKELEQLFSGKNCSQILDQIPGCVYIKDADGVLFACNQEVSLLFQEKDISGKTDFDLLEKNEADQVRANDKKVMENKKKMVFIEKVHSLEKGPISCCTVKAPLFDKQGKVIGIIGHSVEIDEIKDQLHTL